MFNSAQQFASDCKGKDQGFWKNVHWTDKSKVVVWPQQKLTCLDQTKGGF